MSPSLQAPSPPCRCLIGGLACGFHMMGSAGRGAPAALQASGFPDCAAFAAVEPIGLTQLG
jgi:hypothetical protein